MSKVVLEPIGIRLNVDESFISFARFKFSGTKIVTEQILDLVMKVENKKHHVFFKVKECSPKGTTITEKTRLILLPEPEEKFEETIGARLNQLEDDVKELKEKIKNASETH